MIWTKSKPSQNAPAIDPQALPTHVAIIMDGNGRWAKSRGLPRTAGHKKGADSLRTVLNACRSAGVRYLTIYAFSSENWKRPTDEVSDLMQLLQHYLHKELDEMNQNSLARVSQASPRPRNVPLAIQTLISPSRSAMAAVRK